MRTKQKTQIYHCLQKIHHLPMYQQIFLICNLYEWRSVSYLQIGYSNCYKQYMVLIVVVQIIISGGNTPQHVCSCLVVMWKCSSGHFGGNLPSPAQPMTNRMHAGNLLLSSCLLWYVSWWRGIVPQAILEEAGQLNPWLIECVLGTYYRHHVCYYLGTPALLFKFLNLKFISKSLFYHNKAFMWHQLYKAIGIQWGKPYWMREKTKRLLRSDARNDSPGHCAQYCTYTIADMVDKVLLQQNVLGVREVDGRKSTNMESIGMDALLSTNIIIKEVITDGHTGIAALMSKWLTDNSIKCLQYLYEIITAYQPCCIKLRIMY